MKRDFSRLIRPESIAIVGGGAWGASVISAAQSLGYRGRLLPIHPTRQNIAGIPAKPRLEACDSAPDAVFLGINRAATLQAASTLREIGAGGAVCFASGFSEAASEDADSTDLQSALVEAAGEMPILGPNCYGYINALDQAALWPDQHGLQPVERGVAILTQSSNIAINLTMQRRGLPIAMMITCGNMAQTSQAELAEALLCDPRITAIGLHIEGFGDTQQWEAFARAARDRAVPVVALKVGNSTEATHATLSHTASIAGSAVGAHCFLSRLGFLQTGDLSVFLETLKLLHCEGRLSSPTLASISCSGGEAGLVADLAQTAGLRLPPLTDTQHSGLREVLGPRVALANPLDYHTYVWRDVEAMSRAWSLMSRAETGMTLSIVDYPHTDASDWDCATKAALAAKLHSAGPFGVAATLPELMPEDVARQLMAGGVVPFCGLRAALAAITLAATPPPDQAEPITVLPPATPEAVLDEADAKAALAQHGLDTPEARQADSPASAGEVAQVLTPPLALKGQGLAHKSEHGAVCLNLPPDAITNAAAEMGCTRFLIEEMVTGGLAELLIGVVRDPAIGFVLTIGAGGTHTELLRDTASLLLPVTEHDIRNALRQLRCYPLLTGYRGQPAADLHTVTRAILAVQDYVLANTGTCWEVEINPLIVTPTRAVAADALIRKAIPVPPAKDVSDD